MVFEFWSDFFNRKIINIIYINNCVRISHRYASHMIFFSIHKNRFIYSFISLSHNWNFCWCQDLASHINSNLR